jgi:membrane-bound lytic murein transglycosylase D
MRKLLSLLVAILTTISLQAQVQLSIPEAPQKVEFANVLVELSPSIQTKVNEEITKLLTPQNKFLEQKLERMQWYFPIIEKVLEEEDVPEDFKYIAVLESSLLPEAISSSNAVGFWQFKEATAKEIGLRVDNNVDERKNIYESTRAAAIYMKRNNILYKNWISCMMAYKEGPTGAQAHVPVEWSFASEIKFDDSTHPYLISAIANRIAYEHRLNRLKDSSKKFVEYPTRSKSFAEIAVELTVDINDLRKFNPWLYAPNLPEDKESKVLILSRVEETEEILSKIQKRLDVNTLDLGYPQLKRITMVSTSPDAPIFYEINGKKGILAQPGDEVAQMASKSKVKISKFLKYNDMGDRDISKEGQVYYLQSKSKKANVPYHTVMSDQTMWDVSQMYGIQLKRLYKYNRMKSSDRLQTGRVLWMQKTRPKNKAVEIIQDANPDRGKLPIKEEYIPTKESEIAKNKEMPAKDRFEDLEKNTTRPSSTKPVEKKAESTVLKKPTEVVSSTPKPTTTPPNKNIPSEGMDLNDPIFNSNGKTTPKKEVIVEKPKNTAYAKTHTVKQGETLFSIANKYDLSVDQLRRLNAMTANDVLQYNQVLVVSTDLVNPPKVEPKPEPAKVVTAKPERSVEIEKKVISGKTHTVSLGETMYSISKTYGIKVKDIQEWNGIADYSISVGQELIVSNATTAAKPSTQSGSAIKYHKVAIGETLYSISKKYGVTVTNIKNWNNLSDNSIKVGENLIVNK